MKKFFAAWSALLVCLTASCEKPSAPETQATRTETPETQPEDRPPPLFSVTLRDKFPQGKETFEKAKDLILRNYYSPTITEDALYFAAVRGMLRFVSPPQDSDFAKLMTPQETDPSKAAEGELGSDIKVHRLPDKPENKIGWIEIPHVNKKTNESLRQALAAFGTEGIQKVVLDLRDNLGGELPEALQMADLFLPPNVIVLRTFSRKPEHDKFVTSDQNNFRQDLVILVNQKTASSCEVFVAAMRDHKRATVIGDRTQGKAQIDNTFDLPNRYRIQFVTDVMYSPLGKSWFNRGITPDVAVTQSPEEYQKVVALDETVRLQEDAPLKAAVAVFSR